MTVVVMEQTSSSPSTPPIFDGMITHIGMCGLSMRGVGLDRKVIGKNGTRMKRLRVTWTIWVLVPDLTMFPMISFIEYLLMKIPIRLKILLRLLMRVQKVWRRQHYKYFLLDLRKWVLYSIVWHCQLKLWSSWKKISKIKVIEKILRSLPQWFNSKVTVIEESKYLNTLKVDDIVVSLITSENIRF